MKTYDGECIYCGHRELIMQEDQESADAAVSEKCSCGGAAKAERKRKFVEAVRVCAREDEEKNFLALSDWQTDILLKAAEAVFDGSCEKAQFIMRNSTIILTGNATLKVQRKAQTEFCEEV